MARLCRSVDWSLTPLGPPSAWPDSLKHSVRQILVSAHPMGVLWGRDLLQFYNDAFQPLLGDDGRHPAALGVPARECWEDLWHVSGPQLLSVLDGQGPVYVNGAKLPIARDGQRVERYWNYSYNPIYNDAGAIAGVLVLCKDVTQERAALADLQERDEMLSLLGRVGRIGGWRILPEGRVLWSPEVRDLHGAPPGFDPDSDQAADFITPALKALDTERFTRCLTHGDHVDLELQIDTMQGERRWFRTIGEAVRGADGRVVEVRGVLQDIHEQKQIEQRLREGERRFKELAEAMPIVVWTATADGRVDYQNRSILDYTGATPDSMLDDGWYQVLHPDDVPATKRAWAHSVSTGEPYEVEFRIRRATGEYKWFFTRAVPVCDPQGQVVKWFGSSMNVHEQRQSRERLAAMARRFSTTLESITDAFYLLDPDWRFAYVNEEAEAALDRDRQELLGEVIWKAFPETIGTTIEVHYRLAKQAGETQSFRCFFPPLDRWYDIRAYPSEEGLAVYFKDISADVLAERRLREQAELLDRAQDAILVRDLDHRILFWNKGAERIYGWSRHQALGEVVRDLLYHEPERFDRATQHVLDHGEWSGELEHLRSDGALICVEGRWSLVYDDLGNPSRILAINTDITERKLLMNQFLRAQRLESIGTLAGGIAHDLNNVLAPILLSVAMLRQEVTEPALQESLDLISKSAQRGADMVKQVLGFARGYEPSQRRVDVVAILGDIERVVRDTFPKNIEFDLDIGNDLSAISGDPTQVHQVLINLLVNARDAMPQGGVLRLEAKNVHLDEHYAAMSIGAEPGHYLRFSVVDSGAGMPASILDKVFDPFFTTKDVGQGTGLGLSTVAAIARSYGGFVNVYSDEGVGSTFRVYFRALTDLESRAPAAPQVEIVRGQGELILVIDDESSVRDITRQTLEAFGYRVLTAADGAEAIAEYAQRRDEIALVLTDMLMPVMDGPTTIRALRRMDPEVKVIGASGLGANGSVARAADAGLKHFLPKPYSAEVLLLKIREVLEEP